MIQNYRDLLTRVSSRGSYGRINCQQSGVQQISHKAVEPQFNRLKGMVAIRMKVGRSLMAGFTAATMVITWFRGSLMAAAYRGRVVGFGIAPNQPHAAGRGLYRR